MIKTLKRMYHRRKAISPVIGVIILIAITVAAVAIVFFVIIPTFQKTTLQANILEVKDTNKDSQYDEITLLVNNIGTKRLEIRIVNVWTTIEPNLANSSLWVKHANWTFVTPSEKYVDPSEVDEAKVVGEDQITLTIQYETYYKLEIYYSGQEQPYTTKWAILNEFANLDDIVISFKDFDLTAYGFTGTIDDPSRAANNYLTPGTLQPFIIGGEEVILNTSLTPDEYKLLPVPGEDDELIQFKIHDRIVVFHSTNGNLTEQPLMQYLELDTVLRFTKLFLLGLAGSWGDEFSYSPNYWALKIDVTYTDNTNSTWELNHDYIDDWWYGANPGDECISAPSGMVTEIDLGNQLETPHSHIHTHTTRFLIDYYKYVQSITFYDPGTDASAPHLLSITIR